MECPSNTETRQSGADGLGDDVGIGGEGACDSRITVSNWICVCTVTSCWTAGSDGSNGNDGEEGTGGTGATSTGSWDGTTWVLNTGTSGNIGTNGSGGGGGRELMTS